MSRYFIYSAVALSSVLLVRYVWNDPMPAELPEASLAAAPAPTPSRPAFDGLASPFGSALLTMPDQAALIRDRKLRMVNDHCLTPDKYFTMGVRELSNLGKNGDAFASIQLAERYWSEAATLQYDEDMDFSEPPRKIAMRYYALATRGGAGNIPDLVARRLADTGDMTEAAAWEIVAQQFPRTQQSRARPSSTSMSDEQRAAVQSRAEEIANQMGAVL